MRYWFRYLIVLLLILAACKETKTKAVQPLTPTATEETRDDVISGEQILDSHDLTPTTITTIASTVTALPATTKPPATSQPIVTATPAPKPLPLLPPPPPGWVWYKDPLGRYAIPYPEIWQVHPPYNRATFQSEISPSVIIMEIREIPEGKDWLEWVREIRERLPLSVPPKEANVTFKGRPAFFYFDPAHDGVYDQATLLFAEKNQLFRFYIWADFSVPAEAEIFQTMLDNFTKPGLEGKTEMPRNWYKDNHLQDSSAWSITATAKEVLPEEQVIVLAQSAVGFVTITLTENGQLKREDEKPVSWADIEPGTRIQATGIVGPAGTLLTQEIILLITEE